MSTGIKHHFPQQPTGEPSCQFGSTEHHIAFSLLFLLLLGRFLHLSSRAPRLLCVVNGLGAASAAALHGLMGGVCFSPTVAAALHAQFETSPLSRLIVLHLLVNSLVASAVAAHFVFRSEGGARAAKLALLSVLALTNIVAWHLSWTRDLKKETTRAASLPYPIVQYLTVLLSIVLIYSVTKSRALACILVSTPAVVAVLGALNAAFPLDLEGKHMRPDVDAGLHWSVAARALVFCTNGLAVRAALSHVIVAHSDSACHMEPFAADMSLTKTSEWLRLSVLIVLVAGVTSEFFHPSQWSIRSWLMGTWLPRRSSRRILSVDNGGDIQLLWWLPCVILVVMVMPIIRKKHSASRLRILQHQSATGNVQRFDAASWISAISQPTRSPYAKAATRHDASSLPSNAPTAAAPADLTEAAAPSELALAGPSALAGFVASHAAPRLPSSDQTFCQKSDQASSPGFESPGKEKKRVSFQLNLNRVRYFFHVAAT